MTTNRPNFRCLLAGLAVFFVLNVGTAFGYNWTISGKRVVGEFAGYEDNNVSIRLGSGRIIVASTRQLSERDVAYVNNLHALENRRAAPAAPAAPAAAPAGRDLAFQQMAKEIYRSRVLQEAQLQVQLAEFWKSWFDIWIIQFDSRQGPYWVWVAARDSETATQFAVARNPYAEVLWVQKMDRRY